MATLVKDLTSSVLTGVSSFGGKVSDAFGINQATLSGAIDIVVIKHPPGSRPRCLENDYKSHTSHLDNPLNAKYPLNDFDDDIDPNKEYFISSPFHVRFGKLQLLRSNEVNVSITINDKQIDHLQMKLGGAGEAYFVIATNKPLKHKKLLTSPLIKPQSVITINSTTSPSNTLQPPQSQLIAPKLEPILSSTEEQQIESKIDDIPPLNIDNKENEDVAPKKDTILTIDKEEDIESDIKQENDIKIKDINNNKTETLPNSPTLSFASSILSDQEVMSRINIGSTGTDTGTDNESVTDQESVGSMDDDNNDIFNNFSATHVMMEHIGMSLCGNKLIIDSDETNIALFEEYKISYNEFCKNPSLIFDSNLIILYKKRLYPAKIAFPLIFALLSFGKPLSNKAIKKLNKKEEKEEKKQLKNDEHCEDIDGADYSWYWSWFKKKRKKKKRKKNKIKLDTKDEEYDEFDITSKGVLLSDGKMGYFRKSLRPTSEMLSELALNSGVNNITFTVSSTLQGTQSITACIFLWDSTSKIVISDVDGTITKSDVMGHVAPLIVGSQWSHNGVAELFTNIELNGYRLLYLTSRGIGQSSVTRSYLFENVKQRNFSLPFGPIIMSPDSLTTAFYREVIVKRPQEFKIPALSNIQSLFHRNHNPFYGGFGNRESDLESYLKVGVPKHRIFIIKPSGNINTNNKLFKTTYNELNINVTEMFMDQQNKFSKEREEFNSFNYWIKNENYYFNADLTDIDESNEENQENIENEKNKNLIKNNEKNKNKETSIKILNEIHSAS